MSPSNRKLAIWVALSGVTICGVFLVQFLLAILYNRLAWSPTLGVRDHYLAVGQSYAQGFVVGFFSAFFLTVFAIAIGFRFHERGTTAALGHVSTPQRPR